MGGQQQKPTSLESLSLSQRLSGIQPTKGIYEDVGKEIAGERGMKGQMEQAKFQQEMTQKQKEEELRQQALGSGLEVKSANIGGVTFEKPLEQRLSEQKKKAEAKVAIDTEYKKAISKAEQEFKAPSGDVSGRLALTKVGGDYVNNIKSILFPDGTPQSFDRKTAALARLNRPMQQVSRIAPNVDKKDVENAQNINRWFENAIKGKVLIQTGVAARPEEVESERRGFIASAFSEPESAYMALDELQGFYNSFMSLMDPSGNLKERMSKATSQNLAEMSDEELRKLAGE